MEQMDFEKAPRANLNTWSGLMKLVVWSSAAIVIVLSLMAAFLTG